MYLDVFGTCPQKILVLELVTFDDSDPLEGLSSMPIDVDLGFDIEEDGWESSGIGGDFDDSNMKED